MPKQTIIVLGGLDGLEDVECDEEEAEQEDEVVLEQRPGLRLPQRDGLLHLLHVALLQADVLVADAHGLALVFQPTQANRA